ncbi:MAG: GNAT family N-acetyltransferase [Gemmatimonadales bacterium]|nr:GNAT family N-acetyltransferase [Gemmatimonadales bacterium]
MLRGPEPASTADVERINRIFSEAFTDRYHRDGMAGVRVPPLNPAVWRYAIAGAGEGALLWRDESGEIAAFNMVHRSGIEGWMGPLAVRPDHQGRGMGQTIVREGIRRLEGAGARVIGLETMPRTIDNIGFYSRLGFRPGHLTLSVVKEGGFDTSAIGYSLLAEGRTEGVREVQELTDRLTRGLDFTREITLTLDHKLGDTTLVRQGGELVGWALWHTAPLAEGRDHGELRVLKLVAKNLGVFSDLVRAVEGDARREHVRRLSIRCQTGFRDAYGLLMASGYAVHWTDLRMTLEGKHESPPVGGGIVFSNWEI